MRASVAASSTLAAVERLIGIRERLRHPVVHAEVEVAHHEDHDLETLGQIERLHRHRVALFDRGRDQHDLLGVAVRQHSGREQVPLRRARRQPGGRPHALDVEHDAGNFGVVREAGELAHQRDAGARRRRHGPRARPAGADHHPNRRNLVFRLDDGVGRLARLRDPCGTSSDSRSAFRAAKTTA